MYSYFDSDGPTDIPSRAEVARLATEHGIVTALVVDANVCLDLAAFNRRTQREGIHEQTRAFLTDVAASGVDVVAGFGLVELALDRATWRVDPTKLQAIESDISRAIDATPGRDDDRAPAKADDGPVDVTIFESFVPLLKIFYVSLLSIALIADAGLSRARAIPNLQRFLRWAANDLGCVAALPLQVAIAIFGGDSVARRIIGVGKTVPTLNDVWGGAWDLFYISQLYRGKFLTVGGIPQYFIFVTRDRACYSIFSRTQLKGVIHFDESRQPHIVGLCTEYPHYRDQQEALTNLLGSTMLPRVTKLVERKRMTTRHLHRMIASVEREWRGRYPITAT